MPVTVTEWSTKRPGWFCTCRMAGRPGTEAQAVVSAAASVTAARVHTMLREVITIDLQSPVLPGARVRTETTSATESWNYVRDAAMPAPA